MHKSSVVFSLRNVGYGHLDSMINTIEWELLPQVTGIASGTYWTGDIHLQGSVSYGEDSFTNTSDPLQIIYSYNYTLPISTHPPFEIPAHLFGGVIILILTIGILVVVRIRKPEI